MKKMFSALLLLTLVTTASAKYRQVEGVVNLPFYLTVPTNSYVKDNPLDKFKDGSVFYIPAQDRHGKPLEGIGLKTVAFKDNIILKYDQNHKLISTWEVRKEKRKLRKNAVQKLADGGILTDGDVVLSFRPQLANTIPYPHVQLGVTHAALTYKDDDGKVYNLDMPLGPTYNGGNNLSSQFDALHYIEADFLQVVRPRAFAGDERRVKNFRSWIKVLKTNVAAIRNKGQLRFNSDYMTAKYNNYGKEDAFVTTLGKIILQEDKKTRDLTEYCSEFVWAILALSNCSIEEFKKEMNTTKDVSCIKPIFKPMKYLPSIDENLTPIAGLANGPMMILENTKLSKDKKKELTEDLFTVGNMSGLSSGHRAVADSTPVKGLMFVLNGYMTGTYKGEPNMIIPASLVEALTQKPAAKDYTLPIVNLPTVVNKYSTKIMKSSVDNYSPTAFIINTFKDKDTREVDMVATIAFLKDEDFERTK